MCHVTQQNNPNKSFLFSHCHKSRALGKEYFPTLFKRGLELAQHKTSKPDTDNLEKALKDCMTRLHFWKDDAQVASEISEKFWAAVPGIYVRIEELPC